MISNEKAIRLVTTLIRRTLSRELTWNRTNANARAKYSGHVISDLYECPSPGLNFRLYRVSNGVPRLTGEESGAGLVIFYQPKFSNVVLELVDEEGDCIEELFDLPNLNDLFDTVKRSMTDIDGRIDAFLKQG